MTPPAPAFRGNKAALPSKPCVARGRPLTLRHLVIVLGDQLDLDAAAFDGFDAAHDAVWMAEVAEESTHVWSSKPRTVMFLAAMRHFAQALRAARRALHYTRLDDPANHGSLRAQLHADVERLRPAGLAMTAPGDWRVMQAIQGVAQAHGLSLDIREDRHFYCSVREFAAHARGRKSLRMEYFYREMRKRYCVLMHGERGEAPEGGQWNFDEDNREAFGAAGPGAVPPRAAFEPDVLTREVIALVEARFATHPGRLDGFAWPVTREQALVALQRFITERLPLFGRYQDAMWPGEPWLYHAHLAAALNLKLLNPREVVAAAVAAHHAGGVRTSTKSSTSAVSAGCRSSAPGSRSRCRRAAPRMWKRSWPDCARRGIERSASADRQAGVGEATCALGSFNFSFAATPREDAAGR